VEDEPLSEVSKNTHKPRRIGHVGQAYAEAVEAKRRKDAQKAATAMARMHKAASRG